MSLKIGLKKSLLFLWVSVFLCLRPSIFAWRYNLVIFIFLTIVSAFVLYVHRKDLSRVEKNSFGLLLLIFGLVLYLFVQGMLLSSNPRTIFNVSFLVIGISALSLYILRLDKIFIIKSIIYIHVILSVSSIITILLFVLSGFNSDSIMVSSASDFLKNYISSEEVGSFQYDMMFPFSVRWSDTELLGITIPRLTGIYREPGMAQIFFLTAYFLTYVIELKRAKLIRAILLIGGLLTFSTAGLLSLVGGYLVMWFYPRYKIRINLAKTLLILIILPVITIAGLYTPNYGLLAKMESESGKERSKSYQRSLNLITERPWFGWGYYSKSFDRNAGADQDYVDTLGLVGVIYQIGIAGVVLYLLIWFYSFRYFNDYRTYFILMPCFLTLLVSQPSYNDMLVWFLLMFNFKSVANSYAAVHVV